MITKAKILDNTIHLTQKIEQIMSVNRHGFNQYQEIRVLAVSKQVSSEVIEWAYGTGLRLFGENYVNEAIQKIDKLAHLPLEWHFIGHLQTNKAKLVAQYFDWVESVDSDRLAKKLNAFRHENQADLNVCVQVNVDLSATKSGVVPDAVLDLVQSILTLPRLRLRGLMVVPDPNDQLELCFAKTRALFLEVFQYIHRYHGASLASEFDTLSMGMSGDYEQAIKHGSTQVRIGSAIFGERVYAGQNHNSIG